MSNVNVISLIPAFLKTYNAKDMDSIWAQHQSVFRKFWSERLMSTGSAPLSENECDSIIRILDCSGKGNTKNCQAVARVMITQGAWRRILAEFHSNAALGKLITRIFEEDVADKKGALIDELYRVNEGKHNNLTGPSGNAICAFLAAYDPVNNLSVVSLHDRRAIIEALNLPIQIDWDKASIGTRIMVTSKALLSGIRAFGVSGTARTVSRFCYYAPVKALWKKQDTVQKTGEKVSVVVPSAVDAEEERKGTSSDEIRESMQIQALLADIGSRMGLSIWLPRSDRARVLKAWKAKKGTLLDDLPLGYDAPTMKTIEQIDVLWLKKRSILRAFEVEHTTSIYSGILRMADLVALQPNINIKLHIVAPDTKRDKVFQEIQRPVFSLLEGRALADICTFLSYDSIKKLVETKHLEYMTDKVLDDFEESSKDE